MTEHQLKKGQELLERIKDVESSIQQLSNIQNSAPTPYSISITTPAHISTIEVKMREGKLKDVVTTLRADLHDELVNLKLQFDNL